MSMLLGRGIDMCLGYGVNIAGSWYRYVWFVMSICVPRHIPNDTRACIPLYSYDRDPMFLDSASWNQHISQPMKKRDRHCETAYSL